MLHCTRDLTQLQLVHFNLVCNQYIGLSKEKEMISRGTINTKQQTLEGTFTLKHQINYGAQHGCKLASTCSYKLLKLIVTHNLYNNDMNVPV